ncbi:MAG: hypothetical protein GOVbin3205_70 [Prokaryotic dsDNA virus sp.]|nr:MAG: hypothetical protein GOVbin3205_70 [Prokaryotic dsDNA virus sp.]|tara:strand:- start:787 stop:1182 length:396 start_codon:yes stop_codon:yes gene_type:complete
MKKIIDWFGGSVVKDLLGGLDKLFTSKEEKIKAENVIKQILIQKELELQKMQTEIIVAEAKGNWLQRSWRPILMLSFGFIVIYVKFVGPLFNLRIPVLEDEFWTLLQIGIGGYVVGRTGEKMMKSYSETKK